MNSRIQEVCIVLSNYPAHFPCGAVVKYYDGTQDVEYCDNFLYFRTFLDEYKAEIKRDFPSIVVITEFLDFDETNVLDLANQIKDYLNEILFGDVKEN